MPNHHQTLARLDLLVSEACDLCDRASAARGGAASDPEAAVPFAFQTVLGREVRKWLHRAEAGIRTVKPDADKQCGQRAVELRRLVDNANVAVLKRSESGEAWNAFYRSTRDIRSSGQRQASSAPS